MPIAKVFFGMSLKRGEEPQAVAVAESERKEEGQKGLLEMEDVEDVLPGQKRKPRRRVAGGGKMRLRGKLGGRRIRGETCEKKFAEKEAKKQARKELVLALKMSRAEFRKARKEEAKRNRLESKSSESEKKRGRFSRKGNSESRKASRSTSKPKRSEQRHQKVKNNHSDSSKLSGKEKDAGFFKNRREAKKSSSASKERNEPRAPKRTPKPKMTAEEKLEQKQARQEIREAKKAAAAEVAVTVSQDEPKKKKRNAKVLIFSNTPKNPLRPKIRYGKIIHAPKAIRSMRAAVQRR